MNEKIEPCSFCGHTPTVSHKQQMISCKACGVAWQKIDRWNETMKAIRHYRFCEKKNDMKDVQEFKKMMEW